MKKIFTLLVFILISSLAIAQSNYQDVVYLKNGSVIRGIIVEQIPNQSIKIETADRSVFVFKMDEIEKLTREPRSGSRTGSNQREFASSTPHFIRIVELGYEIGSGTWGLDRVKFNFINSYQFNPYFSAGLGTGMRYYVDADIFVLPIFTDLRATIIPGPISPYVALGLGYSLDTRNNFEGMGMMFSPNVGATFRLTDKNSVNIGLGYELQRLTSRYLEYWGSGINSGAVSLTAGFTF